MASFVVYNAPCRFTSTVFRLGFVGPYSVCLCQRVRWKRYGEEWLTVVFEHFIFGRDACVGDDIVDLAGWGKDLCCFEEVELVFPVCGIAFDEFGFADLEVSKGF